MTNVNLSFQEEDKCPAAHWLNQEKGEELIKGSGYDLTDCHAVINMSQATFEVWNLTFCAKPAALGNMFSVLLPAS